MGRLSKTEVEKYREMNPIGVKTTSNWGGIEIIDIIYGIEDYIISCKNIGGNRTDFSKTRVYYTNTGRAFFRRGGQREMLDGYYKFK